MVDTIRTEAELLALFADNIAGDISAQDARDHIVTSFTLQGYDVDTAAPADGYALTYSTSNNQWEAQAVSAGPGGSDTQIQYNNSGSLGGDSGFTTDGSGAVDITGDLDVDNINIDGNTIISTDTNGAINITPDGSGAVVLDGLSWPTADGTGGYSLKTDGAGSLYFAAVAGGSGGTVQGTDATFDIQATADGSPDGDARGESSVDLQTARASSSQVASGLNSVLIGGEGNTASADFSGVFAGSKAVASLYGQIAQASGRIAADGDAQASKLVMFGQTTNATLTEVFLDGSSEVMTLANDTTWGFEVHISARRTDANDESAFYILKGAIDRNASAATTAIVGGVSQEIIAEDDVDWLVSANAETTAGKLRIQVQGEASKTINWTVFVTLTSSTG